MIASHGTTRDPELLICSEPHSGHEFISHIVKPLLVANDAGVFIASALRPSFRVNAIDANQTDAAFVNQWCQFTHHTEIFPVVETTVLRRENQYGVSLRTVNFVFHVALKRLTVVFVIVWSHLDSSTK